MTSHASSTSEAQSAPPPPETDHVLLVGNKRTTDSRVFGRLLRTQRLQAGLSAAEVAESAGVSASFVRSIERGDQAPSMATAQQILAALEVTTVGPHLILTDPETSETYYVTFVAARKGDNSRWSLQNLLQGTPPSEFVNTLTSILLRSPAGRELMAARQVTEDENQLRALGVYQVPDGEAAER